MDIKRVIAPQNTVSGCLSKGRKGCTFLRSQEEIYAAKIWNDFVWPLIHFPKRVMQPVNERPVSHLPSNASSEERKRNEVLLNNAIDTIRQIATDKHPTISSYQLANWCRTECSEFVGIFFENCNSVCARCLPYTDSKKARGLRIKETETMLDPSPGDAARKQYADSPDVDLYTCAVTGGLDGGAGFIHNGQMVFKQVTQTNANPDDFELEYTMTDKPEDDDSPADPQEEYRLRTVIKSNPEVYINYLVKSRNKRKQELGYALLKCLNNGDEDTINVFFEGINPKTLDDMPDEMLEICAGYSDEYPCFITNNSVLTTKIKIASTEMIDSMTRVELIEYADKHDIALTEEIDVIDDDGDEATLSVDREAFLEDITTDELRELCREADPTPYEEWEQHIEDLRDEGRWKKKQSSIPLQDANSIRGYWTKEGFIEGRFSDIILPEYNQISIPHINMETGEEFFLSLGWIMEQMARDMEAHGMQYNQICTELMSEAKPYEIIRSFPFVDLPRKHSWALCHLCNRYEPYIQADGEVVCTECGTYLRDATPWEVRFYFDDRISEQVLSQTIPGIALNKLGKKKMMVNALITQVLAKRHPQTGQPMRFLISHVKMWLNMVNQNVYGGNLFNKGKNVDVEETFNPLSNKEDDDNHATWVLILYRTFMGYALKNYKLLRKQMLMLDPTLEELEETIEEQYRLIWESMEDPESPPHDPRRLYDIKKRCDAAQYDERYNDMYKAFFIECWNYYDQCYYCPEHGLTTNYYRMGRKAVCGHKRDLTFKERLHNMVENSRFVNSERTLPINSWRELMQMGRWLNKQFIGDPQDVKDLEEAHGRWADASPRSIRCNKEVHRLSRLVWSQWEDYQQEQAAKLQPRKSLSELRNTPLR